MKTLTSQVFKSTEIVTWWNQNLTAHRQQQNGRENATIVEIMKYFRLIWPLEWFDPHTHKKQNNSYEMHKIGIVAAMNEAPMCQNHDLIWNSSWNPIKCANGLAEWQRAIGMKRIEAILCTNRGPYGCAVRGMAQCTNDKNVFSTFQRMKLSDSRL